MTCDLKKITANGTRLSQDVDQDLTVLPKYTPPHDTNTQPPGSSKTYPGNGLEGLRYGSLPAHSADQGSYKRGRSWVGVPATITMKLTGALVILGTVLFFLTSGGGGYYCGRVRDARSTGLQTLYPLGCTDACLSS